MLILKDQILQIVDESEVQDPESVWPSYYLGKQYRAVKEFNFHGEFETWRAKCFGFDGDHVRTGHSWHHYQYDFIYYLTYTRQVLEELDEPIAKFFELTAQGPKEIDPC
ncbi:hypothetical protein D9M70_325140 [compost metagenome]